MHDTQPHRQAEPDFAGAKVMIFLGEDMLILLRDHTPGISWPGYLDFPGGGREGTETPAQCAIREAREEVGLVLQERETELVHRRQEIDGDSYFFVAHLPKEAVADVVFGNEGAGWQVMAPQAYIADPMAIPHFAEILESYLKKAGR